MKKNIFLYALILLFSIGCNQQKNKLEYNNQIFKHPENMKTRWCSFENINGEKGKGAIENKGGKGHACDAIESGESKVLMDVQGAGIINRIWITIDKRRDPFMLRALKIEIFWDGEEKPAISAPLGDFFGLGLGRPIKFENEFFVNPEGRSFNCCIPMPFKKGAKVVITNDSENYLRRIFYDINFQRVDSWDDEIHYLHCYWHRDTATTIGEDFEILPKVNGKGRFLGTNIGVNSNPVYEQTWWGEGEVKVYLDGDTEHPTLAGTGTEDYIGTAWGQGKYSTRYVGCPISDRKNKQWAFYRYHVKDPVYFEEDCRVTIQQMGGDSKSKVLKLLNSGVKLKPVTLYEGRNVHLFLSNDSLDPQDPNLPGGWMNFYRSDDFSATAFFYFEKPTSNLPKIQDINIRTANLKIEEIKEANKK